MKQFQVGEFAHGVSIEPTAEPGIYKARVGDRELRVELKPVAGAARVMIVDGVAHAIAIARAPERTWVQVGTEFFCCEPVKGRRGAASGGRKDPEVKSPIAGKVLKLFVAVGDPVTPGQKLISIEAMKMENEIHATLAGKVARIAVSAGQPTQPGDVLIVIEPEPAAAAAKA